ncbi:unnamed protein product [Dimorphilus gyrociliatus]|uniref:Uncharacterized protein n=1 Tax=Dimorphilus gyrociliatus TaxID=2664684 RepID=A0A7I8WBA6_9ANNE|nr:unnamed protein product [Dimorphilus gyrociliatus]
MIYFCNEYGLDVGEYCLGIAIDTAVELMPENEEDSCYYPHLYTQFEILERTILDDFDNWISACDSAAAFEASQELMAEDMAENTFFNWTRFLQFAIACCHTQEE